MIIGVDPHKRSHTASALDPATNTTVASLRIDASLDGYRHLLRWATQFPQRRWAIEGARGLGRHLAQWLAVREEVVLDVPARATARVRELSRGSHQRHPAACQQPPSRAPTVELDGHDAASHADAEGA
jgi:hypothetical protein